MNRHRRIMLLAVFASIVAGEALARGIVKGSRTPAPPPPPSGSIVPSSPTFVTLSGSTPGQKTVEWTAPDTLVGGGAISGDPVTSYKVYWRTSTIPFDLSASDGSATVTAPTATYNITGLTTSNPLYVRVTATNASGESDPSTEESGTVP